MMIVLLQKNLEKIHDYFNLMELTLLYDELLKDKESDL